MTTEAFPEDWRELRKRPEAEDAILKRVPSLRSARHIVRDHRERFDGTGHPHVLKGAQIPLGERLFAKADTLGSLRKSNDIIAESSCATASCR